MVEQAIARHVGHRVIYALLAAGIGVPTMIMTISAVTLALIVGVSSLLGRLSVDGVLMLAWGGSGLLGLLGWTVLSLVFLIGSTSALRKCGKLWWIFLALGMAAALAVGIVWVIGGSTSIWMPVFFGPGLIIPALYLVWMRFGNPGPGRLMHRQQTKTMSKFESN